MELFEDLKYILFDKHGRVYDDSVKNNRMGFVLSLIELFYTRRWLSEDLKKETRRVIDDSVALSLVDDRDTDYVYYVLCWFIRT